MVMHVFDNSNLSQEIFAIDTWRAVMCSLGHGRKHMLTIRPTTSRPGFSFRFPLIFSDLTFEFSAIPDPAMPSTHSIAVLFVSPQNEVYSQIHSQIFGPTFPSLVLHTPP